MYTTTNGAISDHTNVSTQPLPHPLRLMEHILVWSRYWELPYLHSYCTIGYSQRLRRVTGKATPETGEILLNAQFLTDQPDELIGTLAHHAAHVGVHLLWGPDRRKHGDEWLYLMDIIGHRSRATSCAIPRTEQRACLRELWEHFCALCDYSCRSHSKTRRMMCPRCLEDGYLVPLDLAGPA
jgi:predicted SprT family Zn-dependent metalloprotease